MSSLKSGQTSVEFLVLLAVVLIILVAAIMVSQGQVTNVVQVKSISDARNSVDDLAAAAKDVYAQGIGAKKQVFVKIPSAYNSSLSSVGNKSIKMSVAGTDHVATLGFDVHGSLPKTSGGHWVWVISEGNRVRIGDAMIGLDKDWIYLVMNSNETATTSLSVTNIWISGLNVTTNTTWTATEVTLNGVPLTFSLDISDTNTMNLQFTADLAANGFYVGQIEFVATDTLGSTDVVDVPITVQVIPYTQQLNDTLGPLVTNIYQDPTPAIKFQSLVIFVDASDVLTGNSSIKGCQIDADNSNNWHDMLTVDGVYDEVTELSSYNYTAGFMLGPHTIRAKCTDWANNIGPTAYYYFNVSEADQLGPIVMMVNHTAYPTTLSNITVGGIATDSYTGNSNIQSCSVKVDSGSWVSSNPEDGAWDSPTENIYYNVGPLGVGYHTIYHMCTDSLGNVGGIYNDSFGIVDVDLIIVLDRSGSMADTVTNAASSTIVSAASTGWSWVKGLSVTQKNGNLANLSVEIRASTTGCTVFYNATINGITVANGSRTSTSYGTITTSINISSYTEPYTVDLWLKRSSSGCTAYNRLLSVKQQPTKMAATKTSAKSFLDIAGNNIQAGLVSYSTSATTDRVMTLMDPANQQALKNAIDALVASGNTCIQCGLVNAANELVSARARPAANKVIILLTDGKTNVGDSVDGAVYCRDRNITVYTIGFGYDVDDTELTNIALLTNGDYYFAPNAETLTAIFNNIGRSS